jgi:hypothetical protein
MSANTQTLTPTKQRFATPSAICGVSQERALAMLFVERNREQAAAAAKHAAVARKLELALSQRRMSESNLEELRTAYEKAVEAMNRSVSDAEKRNRTMYAVVVAVAVICTVGGWTVGFLNVRGTILGWVAVFILMKWLRDRHAQDAEAPNTVVEQCQGRIQSEETTHRNLNEAIETLQSEFRNGVPQPSVSVIGTVGISVFVRDIAGERVLVDPGWGLAAGLSLTLPSISKEHESLRFLQETIETTQVPPMLLEPGERQLTIDEGLHGEERLLRGAVENLTTLVQNTESTTVHLPLLRWTPEIQRVMGDTKAGTSLSLHVRRPVKSGLAATLEYVSDAAQALAGDESLKLLDNASKLLAARMHLYSELRNDAMDVMHSKFLEAMEHASLLSVDYIDPRQAMVPGYWYAVTGIDPANAHGLAFDDLVERLSLDPTVKRRLDSSPSLLQTLENSYSALLTIQTQLEGGISAREAVALTSQAEQELRTFQNAIHESLTGNRSGRVDVSSASRLEYDPVQAHWVSSVDGRIYSESEAAHGRVLRVQRELMLPMWNALWVEQEQFRKSEMFRTNESLQRMAEKESEKLLAIAESYKADLRPVREKLISHATEAENKMTQLTDTVEALENLGQITSERAEELRRHIGAIGNHSIRTAKQDAGRKELLLSMEPAHQLARRGTAIDPINMLATTEVLYRESNEGESFVLSGSGTFSELSDRTGGGPRQRQLSTPDPTPLGPTTLLPVAKGPSDVSRGHHG